jgi:hypothetical protein
MPRLVVLTLFFAAALPAAGADRIVLRNLEIIRDKKILAMNLDGVQIEGGKTIGWDDIESGKLEGDRQALFDKYLANVGIHLYRIRQRLTVGDYRTLAPHAQAVAKFYKEREGDTAYMVMQALMWGRLAEGKREAAVEPYWRCYQHLRNRQASEVKLPGGRRLTFDAATGMCDELPPIWFDAAAAKSALAATAEAIGQVKQPRPGGAAIYHATLAIAAGDDEAATSALKSIAQPTGRIAQLRQIALAQRELALGPPGEEVRKLESSLSSLEAANKPLALFWLGRAQVGASEEREQKIGVLRMLEIAAVHGAAQPELAAAGLFEAMQALEKMKDVRGSVAVRGELLGKYAQTFHAAKVAGEKAERGASTP